jgi:hypothetical protein
MARRSRRGPGCGGVDTDIVNADVVYAESVELKPEEVDDVEDVVRRSVDIDVDDVEPCRRRNHRNIVSKLSV